ncbi:ATP-binding protein, partial [Campylobacter upsaliensis]|nr:ATP-binding protein [Campylobacter upsaliensis]
GEVKFKNKKICKNVLNDLYKKAQELNLKPNYYIIFSKNGFSKELESLQNKHLLLFDLSHFKALM